MEMNCILEKLSLNFSKFSYPALRQNQKFSLDYSDPHM